MMVSEDLVEGVEAGTGRGIVPHVGCRGGRQPALALMLSLHSFTIQPEPTPTPPPPRRKTCLSFYNNQIKEIKTPVSCAPPLLT